MILLLRRSTTLITLASAVGFAFASIHWPLVGDASLMHYVIFLAGRGRIPYKDIIDVNLPGRSRRPSRSAGQTTSQRRTAIASIYCASKSRFAFGMPKSTSTAGGAFAAGAKEPAFASVSEIGPDFSPGTPATKHGAFSPWDMPSSSRRYNVVISTEGGAFCRRSSLP